VSPTRTQELSGLELKGQSTDEARSSRHTRQVCGIRRRTAIIMIVALLVLAAVVGGTVGGIFGNRNASVCSYLSLSVLEYPGSQGNSQESSQGSGHNPNQQAPSPSPSFNPGNSNPNNTSDTPKVIEPMRSIVASHNNNGMFIFWQKQNGDLWMHAYCGTISRWTDSIKLSNPNLPAINDTTISAML
jgi:hypothetical protein